LISAFKRNYLKCFSNIIESVRANIKFWSHLEGFGLRDLRV
jgi:hypothetical protein